MMDEYKAALLEWMLLHGTGIVKIPIGHGVPEPEYTYFLLKSKGLASMLTDRSNDGPYAEFALTESGKRMLEELSHDRS